MICLVLDSPEAVLIMYMFHAIWKPRAVCRLHGGRAVCRQHAMQSADCAATVSMNYMHVCALER